MRESFQRFDTLARKLTMSGVSKQANKGILTTGREVNSVPIAHYKVAAITFHVTCHLGKIYKKRIMNPKKTIVAQQVLVLLQVFANQQSATIL